MTDGPLRATTLALPPERSSPTSPNPVTSHPGGNGHGSQTGTTELSLISSMAAVDGSFGG
ncbi:hypothetical protein GCM10022248_82330 [Nonomuraea soli]